MGVWGKVKSSPNAGKSCAMGLRRCIEEECEKPKVSHKIKKIPRRGFFYSEKTLFAGMVCEKYPVALLSED